MPPNTNSPAIESRRHMTEPSFQPANRTGSLALCQSCQVGNLVCQSFLHSLTFCTKARFRKNQAKKRAKEAQKTSDSQPHPLGWYAFGFLSSILNRTIQSDALCVLRRCLPSLKRSQEDVAKHELRRSNGRAYLPGSPERGWVAFSECAMLSSIPRADSTVSETRRKHAAATEVYPSTDSRGSTETPGVAGAAHAFAVFNDTILPPRGTRKSTAPDIQACHPTAILRPEFKPIDYSFIQTALIIKIQIDANLRPVNPTVVWDSCHQTYFATIKLVNLLKLKTVRGKPRPSLFPTAAIR